MLEEETNRAIQELFRRYAFLCRCGGIGLADLLELPEDAQLVRIQGMKFDLYAQCYYPAWVSPESN